ncbi:MAG: VWA domain-containing protein [Bacillales bacterium]|jgi:Mg-chelatase subunit ChlD|nr:VWA domain-containing protein [Bacillales bacterium]
MKKDLIELVFILDKSGSMMKLRKETIKGYNGLLRKQKAEKGEARITTVLFNHAYEVIHERVDIKKAKLLTYDDYQPYGSTALLDALGKTITSNYRQISNTAEEDRPEKTLIVIITDGLENASQKYTLRRVTNLITKIKQFSVDFLFLGANIDAIKEGMKIGINDNYCCCCALETDFCENVSEVVSDFRINKEISEDWDKKLKIDNELN